MMQIHPDADIRREIADKRAARIRERGQEEGFSIPLVREVPLIPFITEKMLICEVKRRSPSKGAISSISSAGDQASLYQSKKATHVSVLTEPDYFSGSLLDLMDVKKTCPELAVLRKDFLLSVEDIEVSFRAGADACLLIASLLNSELLRNMYLKCTELGMSALVELHSLEDVQKVSDLKPELIGINCRNLKNFRIYPLQPLKIRSLVDWDCRVIYESGIIKVQDGNFALEAGFSGLLVGEGVVKNPDLIEQLLGIMNHGNHEKSENSWTKLCSRYTPGRPFVKICGLTNRKDFNTAVSHGADLCGFILAPSPRQTSCEFIRSLPESKALKVGVVVLKEGEILSKEIQDLLEEGFLDFIQYHGRETAETVFSAPGYKAIQMKERADLERMKQFYPLPVLIDAFSNKAAGGTGKQIDRNLVQAVRDRGELWIAGGLNPENISEILSEFHPELIDVSSGLESSPGIKDPDKMSAFFKEIEKYAPIQ